MAHRKILSNVNTSNSMIHQTINEKITIANTVYFTITTIASFIITAPGSVLERFCFIITTIDCFTAQLSPVSSSQESASALQRPTISLLQQLIVSSQQSNVLPLQRSDSKTSERTNPTACVKSQKRIEKDRKNDSIETIFLQT
ncbi:PREDICTED: uncharacterized protein LOC105624059 [Atta cephalotes]|uniref:Uncharacterized protein n=1 Tax=Atta cephalotes TaxID=12957 RepID=A0A158NTF2_ATTCE|nr:PREDICTED: uncharacterized protein LOC105624059 [Atta cephalotes]